MPIYEFKCLKCNEVLEILTKSADEEREMVCPVCKGEEFDRILSNTRYMMSGGASSGPKREVRNCSAGSCTTYELPGATQ